MARTGASVVVYLGLGANLGERVATLRSALVALGAAGVEPRRLSPLYESAFVGPGGPQPAYVNAVLEAETALQPLELLRRTQGIEALHGRRPGTHMCPRPLDIDLLFYGRWWLRHPDLVVPHPRIGMRRFVLEPLHDLGALESWPELARRLQTLPREPALRPLMGDQPGARRETVLC